MSLSTHLLRSAATRTAEESARKLGIDPWAAEKLAPIAISLILYGMRRNTATLVGAAALGFALDRYREDLLASPHRLAAADVRARGDAILARALGADYWRGVDVLADLAGIGRHRAAAFFAMTASAVISALSKSRRELHLNALQLQGVVKSEAARIAGADPALAAKINDWVFRPRWPSRIWAQTKAALRRRAPAPSPRMVPAE